LNLSSEKLVSKFASKFSLYRYIVELKIAHAWCKLELGNPCHVALAQCAAKHEGQAHWEGMREMVLGATATAAAGAAAAGAGAGGDGAAARSGGRGVRASAGEVCSSVEEQVECLLELATDPLVLATAWSGWRPWL
jgi:DNA-dependent protein kinase catalytic subunit